jgi:uncharacterized protein (TIGR03032 family)
MTGAAQSEIDGRADDGFAAWLAASGGTVAVTTYQAGKVVFLGWDGTRVTMLPRDFDRPMGLASAGPRLVLATRHAVTLFADAPLLAPDFRPDGNVRYNALFLPRVTYYTGDLSTRDVAIAADGVWLCSARFSCLARLSPDVNFVPAWRPPFVSEVVPEDRCHLNGLCLSDGRPVYVTCLGETDARHGWRDGKSTGGVVVHVPTGEVVARGLSMPHSPRLHEGRLWVLNSGAGEVGVVDPSTGRFEAVAELPGYVRGLCPVGPSVLVGLCQIRERHLFGGLPVRARHPQLLCGMAVLDTRTGRRVGLFEFTAGVHEVFEVRFLPGVRRGMIVGPEKEQARQALTAPDFAYWLRPENQEPVHLDPK